MEKNIEEVARKAMEGINPSLVDQYITVIKYISDNPSDASIRGKAAPKVGSEEYIYRQAESFSMSREPRKPQEPSTVPDEMVSVILHEYFGIPKEDLERVKREHQLSMGAENIVGDLLERYLASVLEPLGWVWCSGSMVKAVDFIKPIGSTTGEWKLLQVKNRDNSENSSSSAIREGTSIQKWHRTFSRKSGSNWEAFPDSDLKTKLSEQGFKSFVKEYLRSI